MSKYLIGAGGHASVIYDIAKKQGVKIDGVFIDEGAKSIVDLPIIDSISNIKNYENDEFMLAFGNITVRQKLVSILKEYNIKWFSLVDINSVVCNDVIIGDGTVVMPGAVVNSGAIIGNHVIVNSGSIVEHGCMISDHVHISPGATVCGNCKIGVGSWIGAGSTVINEITIGDNAIVGAGSIVISNINSEEKVVGNPAKVLKK